MAFEIRALEFRGLALQPSAASRDPLHGLGGLGGTNSGGGSEHGEGANEMVRRALRFLYRVGMTSPVQPV